MKIQMAGIRTLSEEPPRSTAYYYADLERFKRKNNPDCSTSPPLQDDLIVTRGNVDELSEYVESNEVVNAVPIREVPPLRDRQWSLPEYKMPERKLEETYSTAGTFPMPETKEKEPLLAELEVVGRLPLTQLESASGVRRSRSWYLCCPNVGDEEISRESSWRYSSLRPVTAPPMPGQNGINTMVATQSSDRTDDVSTLRAERDSLARALAAERQRAAAAARAHDARLAELHGVIAELVRRRAADSTRAIPEEEVSDECESTTQPAGELDNDADRSRTEQNDSSSGLSPAELPTPQDPRPAVDVETQDDTSDTSDHDRDRIKPKLHASMPRSIITDNCDTSLNLSEKDSELCVSTARCCQSVRVSTGGSCERDRGSSDEVRFTSSPGRCESRQAKIASRVRLRRIEDNVNNHVNSEERRGVETGAGLADDDDDATSAAWRARCGRLEAECRVLRCALARATDTAHRLYCACAVQESSCVQACLALSAADRALETYDVLLALAETTPQLRAQAELVARQLLARLEAERAPGLARALVSPGPWMQHDHSVVCEEWSPASEARLREHAARLKGDTVALRPRGDTKLFSFHDIDEDEIPKSVDNFSMAEMEAAVMMQEALTAREARASSLSQYDRSEHKSSSPRRRRRHWLHAPSETDL